MSTLSVASAIRRDDSTLAGRSPATSALPSPEDLERYQKLLPDAPERLLASGEREQAHRHDIERRLAALDEVGMPKFYAGQRRGHIISVLLGVGYEGIMGIAVLKG